MLSRGIIPALLVSVVLLAGCEAITGPRKPAPSWSKVPLDERVTDAYTGFGFELFRQLRAADPHGNVFVSPTSAAFALAMTYNGAVSRTADEIALALGIGHLDRETINATNRIWLAALRETGDPKAELAIANSIWYRDWFPVRASFLDRVTTYYGAEVLPITTADAINAWVDRETRGRIDEVVEEIADDVVAYLINALYFKADWTHRFDRAATRDSPFRRADGSTVQVPMMWQEGRFETRVDQDMSMVRLPYGSGRFSMILALPREDRGLEGVAERLTPDRWRRWMTEFGEPGILQVGLPRFEVEWESSLVESLKALGMEIPFDPSGADFSDMFEARGAYIDEVIQKTFLRVDEEGTEAAAVTVVEMRVVSGPPTIVFDRPFFLAIYDHATDTILFLGQITDPA
jgi:serine protease inhibitor